MSNITLSTPGQLISVQQAYTDMSQLHWLDEVVLQANFTFGDAIERQFLGKIAGVYNSILDNCRVSDVCVGDASAMIDCGRDASNSIQIQVGRAGNWFKMSRPSEAIYQKVKIIATEIFQVYFGKIGYLIINNQRAHKIYKQVREKDLLNDVERHIGVLARHSQTAKPSAQAPSSKPSETPTQKHHTKIPASIQQAKQRI